jgi:hypothetical protein
VQLAAVLPHNSALPAWRHGALHVGCVPLVEDNNIRFSLLPKCVVDGEAVACVATDHSIWVTDMTQALQDNVLHVCLEVLDIVFRAWRF